MALSILHRVTGCALSVGLLPVFLLGVPLLGLTLWLTRQMGRIERGRFRLVLGIDIPESQPRRLPGGVLARLRTRMGSAAGWREVAYLLLNGELPTSDQLEHWERSVSHHTVVHENIKRQMESFRYDAHPMGMLISTVAALSTFYPDAKEIDDPKSREVQIYRLIAKTPTIAGFAYRHSVGLPYAYPDNDLSYAGNFLNMMFKTTVVKYKPHPVLERALDVLFTLHADHEQNASTSAMRGVGSAHADPYSCMAAAAAGCGRPDAAESLAREVVAIAERAA